MKSRKIKLFASLTSLSLVLVLMVVGIWAASGPVTSKINANVSFTAEENVIATVVLNNDDSKKAVFDKSTPSNSTKQINLFKTADQKTDVGADGIFSYTITVTNTRTGEEVDAEKNSVQVSVDLPNIDGDYSLVATIPDGDDEGDEADAFASAILTPGDSITITITFKVDNLEIGVQSADIGVRVSLTPTYEP